ncbi:MAG: TonB C-terminal domain-containing protein [Pseudomonadota bacterium]
MSISHFQNRFERGVCVRLIQHLIILIIVIAPPAYCQDSHAARSAEAGIEVRAFDIPAQPLSLALRAYSAATDIQLFYESELVAGRTSSQLCGLFSPRIALQILLRGTGLKAVSFDPGTETLLAAQRRATSSVDLQRLQAQAIVFQPYFALIQSSLRSALCRAPETRVGGSEVRAQLWITKSGAVQRAELLSSTGSLGSDQAYIAALQALSVGPPPAAMPQPITLLILPRQSPDAAECRSLQEVPLHD